MSVRRGAGVAILCCALVFASLPVLAETLQEAVEEVIRTHPDVRSQAYNRLARDQEVEQAKAGWWPVFDVAAGLGIEDVNEPIDEDLDVRELRLSLRQNLFAGFSTENEIDRQQARVRSSAYRLQSVAENTALDASRVYLDVLRGEELKLLADENLLMHERIADQIRLRSESGVGSQVDFDQVQGRLSLARSNVVITRTNLLDAQTNYMAVIGHLPGDLIRPVIDDTLVPLSLEDAKTIAVENHPQLKSAIADLNARNEQHEVAKSPFWPRVDVEIDQVWDEDADSAPGKDESLAAVVRLRYNLFNGWSDKARKTETFELIEEAREIKNSTHRQVVESIRLSWMAYQAVLDRLVYLEQYVDSATLTASAYDQQFNLNKRTLLDVLDSKAEVINAKRDLINTMYDGLYAQYRILNGTGQLIPAIGSSLPVEAVVAEDELAKQDELNRSERERMTVNM